MKGDYSRNSHDASAAYAGVLLQQGRVLLDADWNEHAALGLRRHRLALTDLIGLGGVPDASPTAFQVSVSGGGTLQIDAGRLYVDGILVENGQLANIEGAPAPGTSDTAYVVYLEVWEDAASPLDDAAMRDVALEGLDTARRRRVRWRVRFRELDTDCATTLDAVRSAHADSRDAQATFDLQTVTAGSSPCLGDAAAGYRGPGNHLIRVEVHESGAVEAATIKWSRDNGATEARATVVDGAYAAAAQVSFVVSDQLGVLQAGDTVELTDTRLDRTASGVFGEVARVDGPTVVVELGAAFVAATGPDATEFDAEHIRLRKWEVAPVASSATATSLDDGITVAFSGTNLLAGDAWTVAVRSTDGSIERQGEALAPDGADRHFVALAQATLSSGGTWTLDEDCRPTFVSLTTPAPPPATLGSASAVHMGPPYVLPAGARTPGAGSVLLFDTPVAADVNIVTTPSEAVFNQAGRYKVEVAVSVEVQTPGGAPANVSLWLEFATSMAGPFGFLPGAVAVCGVDIGMPGFVQVQAIVDVAAPGEVVRPRFVQTMTAGGHVVQTVLDTPRLVVTQLA